MRIGLNIDIQQRDVTGSTGATGRDGVTGPSIISLIKS